MPPTPLLLSAPGLTNGKGKGRDPLASHSFRQGPSIDSGHRAMLTSPTCSTIGPGPLTTFSFCPHHPLCLQGRGKEEAGYQQQFLAEMV